MNAGLRLSDAVDQHGRMFRREMQRLHQALTREAAPPVRVIGHMHLDAPSDDPKVTGDSPSSDSSVHQRRKHLADGPWTWVITDSTGVLLRRVPAQPLGYKETSADEARARIKGMPWNYEDYE